MNRRKPGDSRVPLSVRYDRNSSLSWGGASDLRGSCGPATVQHCFPPKYSSSTHIFHGHGLSRYDVLAFKDPFGSACCIFIAVQYISPVSWISRSFFRDTRDAGIQREKLRYRGMEEWKLRTKDKA